MHTEIYDKYGNLLQVIEKPLAQAKTERIEYLKNECGRAILRAVPQYKQNNIAMGIYGQEESDSLKTVIQSYRNQCNDKEAQVLDAETVEEVGAINFEVTQ